MTEGAHPVLGILGGMGPAATVDLMRRIVERTPARDDVDHVHMLVENNPKIPSRIAHLIDGTGPDPTPELVRIARNLQAGGATVLAMPCNTAHSYAPAIIEAVSIPLLDMVALTVKRVVECTPTGKTRVGLLASTAVHLTGVYSRALTERDCTLVAPRDQDEVMALIKGVKSGRVGTIEQETLRAIAARLAAESDVIVVACTELSVLAEGMKFSVPIIDSLDVLTDAILTVSLPPKD